MAKEGEHIYLQLRKEKKSLQEKPSQKLLILNEVPFDKIHNDQSDEGPSASPLFEWLPWGFFWDGFSKS